MRRIVALYLVLAAAGPAAAQFRVSPPSTSNPEIGGKYLDQWMREAEDQRDPSVRENALKMIGLLGPAAKKAAPILIRQMSPDNDLSPMANATIAIGLVQADDPKTVKDSVEALNRLLGHDQGIIRYQAANALAAIGPHARAATPRLATLSHDKKSWEIRKAAVFALGRVGRDDLNLPDIRALVALVDAVDDPAKEVRVEALQSLVNLGPPTNPADQLALKQRLEGRIRADRDKFASIWLRVALMRMDATAVNDANINWIAKELKSNEPGIAGDAARALGAMGPAARSKVPELIACLQSKDNTLVAWAAWALGNMGSDGKPAVTALESLKDSTDTYVKQMVDTALKNINNPPKQ